MARAVLFTLGVVRVADVLAAALPLGAGGCALISGLGEDYSAAPSSGAADASPFSTIVVDAGTPPSPAPIDAGADAGDAPSGVSSDCPATPDVVACSDLDQNGPFDRCYADPGNSVTFAGSMTSADLAGGDAYCEASVPAGVTSFRLELDVYLDAIVAWASDAYVSVFTVNFDDGATIAVAVFGSWWEVDWGNGASYTTAKVRGVSPSTWTHLVISFDGLHTASAEVAGVSVSSSMSVPTGAALKSMDIGALAGQDGSFTVSYRKLLLRKD